MVNGELSVWRTASASLSAVHRGARRAASTAARDAESTALEAVGEVTSAHAVFHSKAKALSSNGSVRSDHAGGGGGGGGGDAAAAFAPAGVESAGHGYVRFMLPPQTQPLPQQPQQQPASPPQQQAPHRSASGKRAAPPDLQSEAAEAGITADAGEDGGEGKGEPAAPLAPTAARGQHARGGRRGSSTGNMSGGGGSDQRLSASGSTSQMQTGGGGGEGTEGATGAAGEWAGDYF